MSTKERIPEGVMEPEFRQNSRSVIPENSMSFLQGQGAEQIFDCIRETDTEYLTGSR